MNARARSQLARVESADIADAFDLAVIAGLGLVGAFLLLVVAPCAKRLVLIDDDRVTETTTILAPYSMRDVGSDKAEAAARFVRRRFDHLRGRDRTLGLSVDVRTLGAGFWRAAARLGRVALFSCLDNVESVAYAARMARGAGMPAVVVQVGPAGVEALAFPSEAGEACFGCIGLTPGASRPCLGVKREEAEPTISTPAAGALSAAVGFDLARRLVDGQLDQARDVRLSFDANGIHFTDAVVARSATCGLHEEPAPRGKITAVSFTSLDTWFAIADALGRPDAVLELEDLPPISVDMPESGIPLAELGVGLWPVLQCRLGGAPALLELAGDARRLNVAMLNSI